MRSVGRSGLRVSALALGTRRWGVDFDQETARELLEKYLDAGGTVIDTAPKQETGVGEEPVGALLDHARRREVVLVGHAGLDGSHPAGTMADPSRRTLLNQLDASLRRLRTDHLDLWMVRAWSDAVPLEETLSALQYAVSTGRARYVGVGGYLGWQLARAATLGEAARLPLVACGTPYSLLQRWEVEDDLAAAAAYLGIGLLAWAPLAGGVLTGKYRRGVPAQSRAASGAPLPQLPQAAGPVVQALVTAAEGLGRTPAEVALAWVRQRDGVASVSVGARTGVQLDAALRSASLTIPDEVTRALDEVSDEPG